MLFFRKIEYSKVIKLLKSDSDSTSHSQNVWNVIKDSLYLSRCYHALDALFIDRDMHFAVTSYYLLAL